MQTITAVGREQHMWPCIGWSFKPNPSTGIIEKKLDKGSASAIAGAMNKIVQFGTSIWTVSGVRMEKVKSEKGRSVERMKVIGTEIQCRGEIRDGGGVIRVWFDAKGKTWEASKMNGWVPKAYDGNQTLAEPYKADVDTRKCIGMAAMHLPVA